MHYLSSNSLNFLQPKKGSKGAIIKVTEKNMLMMISGSFIVANLMLRISFACNMQILEKRFIFYIEVEHFRYCDSYALHLLRVCTSNPNLYEHISS